MRMTKENHFKHLRRASAILLALVLLMPCVAQGSAPEAVFLPEYPKGVSYEDGAGRLAQKKENEMPGDLAFGIYGFAGETAAALLQQPDKNFCYSPLSLYYALLLAAGGADGETKAELYDALGLTGAVNQGATPLALAEMAGTLVRRIHLDDEKRALKIAHAVWLQREFGYQPGFVDIAAAQYGELYSADFADPATGSAMGSWVAEHTRGLLTPEIKTDADQSLAICNTVYLKAPWTESFYQIGPRPFSRQDRTESECDFMAHTFSNVSYSSGEGYQWVALTLDGNIQMMLVLPDEGVPLGSLLATQEQVMPLITSGRGRPRKVYVELPKFAYDTSIDLKEMLHSIGIVTAFDAQAADFSALSEWPLFLTEARQDIRIDVDEDGIEAAAFTILSGETMAMPGETEEPIDLIFNRPFFYCVAAEGVPLFIGVVMDPSE